MKEQKLDTISNLFEGIQIRSIWNPDEEEYYFSIVDVIGALTNATITKTKDAPLFFII